MANKEIILYNPALLSPEDLRDLFLVRHAEFAHILSRLHGENTTTHHALIIGDRGMGKSTLLVRLSHAAQNDSNLCKKWLPVLLDEEQYNISQLADFWLNCLEKIAESTTDKDLFETIDQLLDKYIDSELEEAARLQLREYSLQKQRQLLLLVDNVDIILSRIDPDHEAHRLRDVLQSESYMTLIGTSVGPVLETTDYNNPFYELFEVVVLRCLSQDEFLDLLKGLGEYFGMLADIDRTINARRNIIDMIYIMIGGNVRATVFLFNVLRQHPSADIGFLLEHLFDRHTNLYKDLIESLPPQGQRVFDALARNWSPATAEHIARNLRIKRGVASGQLHRMVERSIVAKVDLPQRSIGFQIRDRFFNLWYLMRGGRRQRRSWNALVNFINLFYRHGRPADGFERLIAKLQRLGLVAERDVEAVRQRVMRSCEKEPPGQAPLFRGRDMPTKINLLARCCYEHLSSEEIEENFTESFSLIETLREMGNVDLILLRIVEAHLHEDRGEIQEALSILEEDSLRERSPWTQLEIARLRIRLGKIDEENLERIFHPVSQFEKLPVEELAAAASGLAREGGEAVAWELRRILRNAAERAPEEMSIPLAGCQIELTLERRSQAIGQYREALRLRAHEFSADQQSSLLHMGLTLAAHGLNEEVLECLEEAKLVEEWQPMAHALTFLGPDTRRLEKLAPEMKALTEIVVERIHNIQSTKD